MIKPLSALRNEDFLSYKVSVLSRILDRGVDKKLLRGLNLPLTALRVLGHLHAHGEGRIRAIARDMHMLGSHVSQSMLELVEHRLVSRTPDPSDKRGVIFRLTPKGRGVYEAVLVKATAKQQEVAGVIGESTYRVVCDALDALIEHYGTADEPTDE